jgi:hypothetical protein
MEKQCTKMAVFWVGAPCSLTVRTSNATEKHCVFVKVGTKFLSFIQTSVMLMRVKEFMTDVSRSDIAS